MRHIDPPLSVHAFDAAAISATWPPRTQEANKKAVWAIAHAGAAPSGTIMCSRWRAPAAEAWQRGNPATVDLVPGFFTYQVRSGRGEHHWHVNFANYDLFSAYGTQLLAQDELQVLEHPALASVRHALQASGASTLCTDGEEPWPILVSGVERRVAFDTRPSPMAQWGLYGNLFARGTTEAVQAATRKLDPPTISNILAIEAPAYGSGPYTAEAIEMVLRTAAAGFAAAVEEPGVTGRGSGGPTVIHTGFWGCGAYGGNRELMCLMQLLAAEMAGVARLVFYAADDAGIAVARQAMRVYGELPAGAAITEVIGNITARGYRWGVSNGT